jgi:hypothetical protein
MPNPTLAGSPAFVGPQYDRNLGQKDGDISVAATLIGWGALRDRHPNLLITPYLYNENLRPSRRLLGRPIAHVHRAANVRAAHWGLGSRLN